MLNAAKDQTDEFSSSVLELTKKLEDMYHRLEEFNDSPTASVYQNAYRELDKLNRISQLNLSSMEKAISSEP